MKDVTLESSKKITPKEYFHVFIEGADFKRKYLAKVIHFYHTFHLHVNYRASIQV